MPSRGGHGSKASLFSFGDGMSSMRSRDSAAWSVATGIVDPKTEMSSWFVSGLPRAEVRKLAMDLLEQDPPGSFLVRDVKSEPNCYGLSVKTRDKSLVNYLIQFSARKRRTGAYLQGTKHVFPNLSSLVEYYSEQSRPELGIQLMLPKTNDPFEPHYSDDEEGSALSELSEGSISVESMAFQRVDKPRIKTADIADVERWAMNAAVEREEYSRSLKRPKKKKSSKADDLLDGVAQFKKTARRKSSKDSDDVSVAPSEQYKKTARRKPQHTAAPAWGEDPSNDIKAWKKTARKKEQLQVEEPAPSVISDIDSISTVSVKPKSKKSKSKSKSTKKKKKSVDTNASVEEPSPTANGMITPNAALNNVVMQPMMARQPSMTRQTSGDLNPLGLNMQYPQSMDAIEAQIQLLQKQTQLAQARLRAAEANAEVLRYAQKKKEATQAAPVAVAAKSDDPPPPLLPREKKKPKSTKKKSTKSVGFADASSPVAVKKNKTKKSVGFIDPSPASSPVVVKKNISNRRSSSKKSDLSAPAVVPKDEGVYQNHQPTNHQQVVVARDEGLYQNDKPVVVVSSEDLYQNHNVTEAVDGGDPIIGFKDPFVVDDDSEDGASTIGQSAFSEETASINVEIINNHRYDDYDQDSESQSSSNKTSNDNHRPQSLYSQPPPKASFKPERTKKATSALTAAIDLENLPSFIPDHVRKQMEEDQNNFASESKQEERKKKKEEFLKKTHEQWQQKQLEKQQAKGAKGGEPTLKSAMKKPGSMKKARSVGFGGAETQSAPKVGFSAGTSIEESKKKKNVGFGGTTSSADSASQKKSVGFTSSAGNASQMKPQRSVGFSSSLPEPHDHVGAKSVSVKSVSFGGTAANQENGKENDKSKKSKRKSRVRRGTGVDVSNVGIDYEYQQRVHEQLRLMEEEEKEKRRKFEVYRQKRSKEITRLNAQEQRIAQLQLDKDEKEEARRQRKWDKKRAEREAKYLMNHQDTSKQLLEYLADLQEQQERLEEERSRLEKEASSQVKEGSVARLKEMFGS